MKALVCILYFKIIVLMKQIYDVAYKLAWLNKTFLTSLASSRIWPDNFCDNLSETLSEGQLQTTWFIQHGAPPHTAHDDTTAYQKGLFNSRFLAHWSQVGPTKPWSWSIGLLGMRSYKSKPCLLTGQ